MNKYLKIILLSTGLCNLSYPDGFAQQPQKGISNPVVYQKMGASMPEVRLINSKDENIPIQLDSSKMTLIVMFNPTCDHCENMAISIVKNEKLTRQYNFIFVTPNFMSGIDEYIIKTKITSLPNVIIGRDNADILEHLYLSKGIPQVNIYTAERTLLSSISGKDNWDEIQKIIDIFNK